MGTQWNELIRGLADSQRDDSSESSDWAAKFVEQKARWAMEWETVQAAARRGQLTANTFLELGQYLCEIGADLYIRIQRAIESRLPGERDTLDVVTILLLDVIYAACERKQVRTEEMLTELNATIPIRVAIGSVIYNRIRIKIFRWALKGDEPAGPHMTWTELKELWQRAGVKGVRIEDQIKSGKLSELDSTQPDGTPGVKFGKKKRSPNNRARYLYADSAEQRKFLETLRADKLFWEFL